MIRWIEFLVEKMAWLRIMVSPLLTGLIIGLILYFAIPNIMGKLLAIGVSAAGLVLGIIWANRAAKKHGAVHYISREMATPELGRKDENENP